MKKIIISLIASSVLLITGCFIDSDTATVRINLGNMPIAKVEKKSLIDRFLMIFAREAVAQVPSGVTAVHIGAFDSNNQLLAKKSISVTQNEGVSNTIVEFDVPARSGVTIVVLGEFTPIVAPGPPMITYYGKNDVPLNLTAGATETVTINMRTINQYSEYINYKRVGFSRYEWELITGAKRYYLYDSMQIFLDSTYNNYYDTEQAGINLEIEFQFTDIKSNWIDYCG